MNICADLFQESTILNRYRMVFLMLSSFYVACNIAYTVLATSDRQHWDETNMRNKFGYHNAMIGMYSSSWFSTNI